MTSEEIYLTIKSDVTKGLYSYDDQITAIALWIESEFEPKQVQAPQEKVVFTSVKTTTCLHLPYDRGFTHRGEHCNRCGKRF